MKILLDMNIPAKYAALLSNKGIEFLRWSDVGSPNAKDSQIMAYARDNGYIVLTFDLDFGAILSGTHDSKPSIVQIRASIRSAEQAVDLWMPPHLCVWQKIFSFPLFRQFDLF